MRTTVIRGIAVVAMTVLLSTTAVGTPAQASSRSAPGAAQAGHLQSALEDCEVTPAPGQGTIHVRSQPTTSSGVVDYLQQGEFMESGCAGQSGGSYNACGGASSSWVWVHLGLNWYGYVARRCVTLYRWP